VKPFKGKKYIHLSTLGHFGGKNSFLQKAYLISGVMCILLGISFQVKKFYAKDQFQEYKND